ncbi:MAG: extracellular solute-binding protein [Anaerolineales bacterium]|nr:extracellular solute-binding protein [Anaerolineales bacterium]
MNKQKPPFLYGFLCLAIALTSCSQLGFSNTPTSTSLPSPTIPPTRPATAEPTPTEAITQGTISIWHSLSESETPALVQIIKNFQPLYPNVYFDVLYVPEQYLQERYITEAREGSGPNLLLAPADWGPALYDAGSVANLMSLVQEDLLAAISAPALEQGLFHGMLIGLPYSISGVVLYRNKDILTLQADTFEELATFAQSSTQGEIVGAVLERSFLYSGAHLIGIGGQLMDTNGNPLFNDISGAAWVELLRSFSSAGAPTFLTDSDLQAFKEGRAGWIIDGTWNLAEITAALGPEKVAIDPWPSFGAGRLSGFVMAQNLFINSHTSDHQLDATWKFIVHLLSAESQAYLAEVGRIPAVTGVQVPNTSQGALISQAVTALAGGTSYPILPVMDVYTTQLDAALRLIFETGATPLAALNDASNTVQINLTGLPVPTTIPITTPLTMTITLTPTP